jgi:hypothetical protein
MITKSKLLPAATGLTQTLGMGVAAADPAPASDILGIVNYQAMSSQQIANVTSETRPRNRIKNVNNTTNINTNTVCLAACAAAIPPPGSDGCRGTIGPGRRGVRQSISSVVSTVNFI